MGEVERSLNGHPILVAVDLWGNSEKLLTYACEMAAKLGHSLILLHVMHETVESAGMYRRYNKATHKANDTTPNSEIAKQMLEDMVEEFGKTHDCMNHVGGISLEIVDGVPETRIPETANRLGAGMIIVGDRERKKGLNRFLRGSVCEAVVHRASCSVVVLRPSRDVHEEVASHIDDPVVDEKEQGPAPLLASGL